jgi:hypothetical protein
LTSLLFALGRSSTYPALAKKLNRLCIPYDAPLFILTDESIYYIFLQGDKVHIAVVTAGL